LSPPVWYSSMKRRTIALLSISSSSVRRARRVAGSGVRPHG
jgi:hypothetical protein